MAALVVTGLLTVERRGNKKLLQRGIVLRSVPLPLPLPEALLGLDKDIVEEVNHPSHTACLLKNVLGPLNLGNGKVCHHKRGLECTLVVGG